MASKLSRWCWVEIIDGCYGLFAMQSAWQSTQCQCFTKRFGSPVLGGPVVGRARKSFKLIIPMEKNGSRRWPGGFVTVRPCEGEGWAQLSSIFKTRLKRQGVGTCDFLIHLAEGPNLENQKAQLSRILCELQKGKKTPRSTITQAKIKGNSVASCRFLACVFFPTLCV